MPLILDTITFRHDPNDPATSALNIRRNKDFEVLVPEWDRAAPRPQAESCAAYALAPTASQSVRVAVVFSHQGSAAETYEVRARVGGVLGRISKFTVSFTAMGPAQVTVLCPLDHRSFDAVGRHDVHWRWQYRKKGSSTWKPLANTLHRIYLTLALPVSPWNQVFADKHNPWTDLLDECCVAAAGSTGNVAAATAMAQRIHLGFPLKYDIQFGAPRYGFGGTAGSFDLTEWIDYVLRGNAPTVPSFCGGDLNEYPDYLIVNCYDCAASLGLMADVLGAPLGYYFHSPFGYLNYVLPIGRGKCNNPFPGCNGTNFAVGPDDARTGFGNHAYTKLNGGHNFDACMREWVSPLTRFILLLIWLIILILTLGMVNLTSLRLRADGWLIDLAQSDYNARAIDVSQPFEASAAAGGTQVACVLDFQVT